ncbi:MAG: TolC family protein [Bacteroidales bacterium]|jgi:outer membrane protein TolC
MNTLRFDFLYRSIIAISIACNLSVYGQTSTNKNSNAVSGDSLTLAKIISTVVQTHPSVKEMIEAITSADAGVGLAKSGYYPNAEAEASYTRLGPASELTIPHLGSFSLYPVNNYSVSVSAEENIYDFGKTARSVAIANEVKNLSTLSVEQVKQKLASTVTYLYYTAVYLQEAIVINKEQLRTLNDHLDFITKKKESGSATQYEILSTNVKISNVQSQGIDLLAALDDHLTELNSLMGQPPATRFAVKKDIQIKLPDHPSDSLIPFAYAHRDETKILDEKTTIAGLKYKLIKVQNNPVLQLYATGGEKNGFFPNLNAMTANYVAGVGFKYPLFDGTRTKYCLLQAKSAMQTTSLETDIAKRSISSEVTENQENIFSALKKIEHNQLQLSQAQEAFALAQTSFKAGSITNLDMLDAATSVSESKLLLLKSKIDYILNVYKLKASIGERLY